MELKQTALGNVHRELGAKMVPFAGFEMPVRYTSDLEEHMQVRKGVGVFDVSHMGEFLVQGSQALDLIQKVTSNDASKLTDGRAQYSCLPNEDGGIVDDLLVYRLNQEKYMLVVNASNIQKDWDWIAGHNHYGVEMVNISDATSLLAVQGPNAQKVLQKLTSVDLDSIPYYHFTLGDLAGASDIIISATGYTGSGGFEVYVPNEQVAQVWNELFEKGKENDIQPIGLGARDTLRLEAGFCLYGNDIDDHTSPLEAGLGWITKFTKDFVNSENLKKQKEIGVSQRLVGFRMTEKGIPRQGYAIHNENDEPIGRVTSGTISPMLNQGIGMGYVQTGYWAADTDIFIHVRGRSLAAKVVRPPFVDLKQ